MEDEKKYVISAALDEKENAMLNDAKDMSGIKGTSDLIRFLLKLYTNREFVPPKMRQKK